MYVGGCVGVWEGGENEIACVWGGGGRGNLVLVVHQIGFIGG